MKNIRLYDSEYKLMKLIWENEPVKSTKLKNLCEAEYQWKKSTVYTILKKLKDKELILNEDATITSLVSVDEVVNSEAKGILNRYFGGDVPSFVASFIKDKNLKEEEIEEIIDLIRGTKDDGSVR